MSLVPVSCPPSWPLSVLIVCSFTPEGDLVVRDLVVHCWNRLSAHLRRRTNFPLDVAQTNPYCGY